MRLRRLAESRCCHCLSPNRDRKTSSTREHDISRLSNEINIEEPNTAPTIEQIGQVRASAIAAEQPELRRNLLFLSVGFVALISAGSISSALLTGGDRILTSFITCLFVMVYGLVSYDKFVDIRNETALTLTGFSYLDAALHPNQCINYVHWCETDATIAAYQRQVVAMGRKPMWVEYHAAKQWYVSRDARIAMEQKIAEAHAACERLQVADF